MCVCVTRRYSIKTAKRRITQTTAPDSPWNLVFWRQNSLVDDPPLKFALKVTHPSFKKRNFEFRPIFAYSTSTVRAGKKSSISANRKSMTRFPTSHRSTVYVTLKSPKGWHKTRFCYFFPVNFNFCRKKSAAKFLRVKTSSGNLVGTSFLYLTVHRWIAGDVPIYLKFALKVTHVENADLDRLRLILAQPW